MEESRKKTGQKTVEQKLWQLIKDNEENLAGNPCGYDKGYAEGFHDAILDVFSIMGIRHDLEYFN